MVETSEEATVSCSQMPEHLKGHIDAIRGWRTPQFVVVKGHNNFKVTNFNYMAAFDHLSSFPILPLT